MRRHTTAWALVTSLVTTAACSATINPASIADAQTAARVKSVLVNDPAVGIHPIEVRVTNGVARLSGRVPTAADAERAVALARSVPGVSEVRSEVVVGGAPAVPSAGAPRRPAAGRSALVDPGLGTASDRRLLAVGASMGWNGPNAGGLDASRSLGPIVRLGTGRGLGLAIGFGWFGADLGSDADEAETVGRIRVRPVMGGLGYTVGGDRVSMSLSAVAGISINSVNPANRLTGRQVPLGLANSLAWRPGVSLWLETSSRTAVNLSAGYVMTRPRLTLLDDGEVVRRSLTADALLLRVGLAFKVF